jgi:hypothetical protein
MCTHHPRCPAAHAPDHASARVIARQEDLGWSLLCNKVIVFEDTGEILPGGAVVQPNRPAPRVPQRHGPAQVAVAA